MKKHFIFLTITCLYFITSCGPQMVKRSISNGGDAPDEGGKCYAKCKLPDRYENYTETHFVYTGSNYEQAGVLKVEEVIQSGGERWEKKKTNNCASPNPDDCLVWCLVTVEPKTNIFYAVADTNMVKDYTVKTVQKKRMVSKGGYIEFVEVLCASQVTKNLIHNMKIGLAQQGYLSFIDEKDEVNKEVKAALIKFQTEKGLPIGALNLETMDSLGVKY